MEPISVQQVAQALGARVVGEAQGMIESICTDTREGARGSLFFALRGEHADGHHYVGQAFEKGAMGAVVERRVAQAGGPLLLVSDTLRALGDLARFYRDRFALPVIGVTGSVGKTSTKEMIACALRARLSVLANVANYNNEIGLPRTLFGLEAWHQAAVLEMAMRGRGEIARLAEIARPSIGVLTNIGLSHVERLGSREGIALAKGELLEALPPDGVAVLNVEDDYYPFLRERCRCRVVTFGVGRPADFRATDLTLASNGTTRFYVNGQEIVLPALGVHHAGNAAAACAVAAILAIPLSEVAGALASFQPPPLRMEIMRTPDGLTLLNDAYNAAPDSMRAALQTLRAQASLAHQRAVAILGDMKELGDYSAEAHRGVGAMAAQQEVDLLITVGQAAEEIARAAQTATGEMRTVSFPDADAAAQTVRELLQSGDVVLIKGSRAMAMEKVVAALLESPTGPDRAALRCSY